MGLDHIDNKISANLTVRQAFLASCWGREEGSSICAVALNAVLGMGTLPENPGRCLCEIGGYFGMSALANALNLEAVLIHSDKLGP